MRHSTYGKGAGRTQNKGVALRLLFCDVFQFIVVHLVPSLPCSKELGVVAKQVADDAQVP